MKTITLTPLSLLLLFAMAGTARAQLYNGNFETGDFSGWTEFNTVNGGTSVYQVVQFDTAGTGTPSYAAEFEAGEVSGGIGGGGLGQGAGIYQNVSLGAGTLNIFLDIAALSPANQADAGTFQLLVDGNVVASDAMGAIGFNQTLRSTLSYSGNITAGTHQIAVDIRRGYGTEYPDTPYEFLDNITLTGTAVPEPNAALLFAMAGVCVIPMRAIAKRRKLKSVCDSQF
ncbi:MAG TPA: hypothetical protein VKV04_22180 [Verrucomicrobiae bacterium]|nr:hypothetical protein [Verrucomicrobiae bacterium]